MTYLMISYLLLRSVFRLLLLSKILSLDAILYPYYVSRVRAKKFASLALRTVFPVLLLQVSTLEGIPSEALA